MIDNPQPASPGTPLPTKFFVPVLDNSVVERRRVLDLMDGAPATRLVLVSAPAGSGKTTLVTNWIRRADVPVAWVSLDSGDDDPQAFLTCLVEGLQTLGPDVCARTRCLLAAGAPPDPRMVATSLVADLVRSGQTGLVVLDDLHALASPAVYQLLTLLLERGPPSVRFVLITRSDPPLPLARMRARGELAEIREADLRFRCDEAGDLLARLCDRRLQPGAVAGLAERTEGWAVGLQLAGIALRKVSDPEAFVLQFRGTHTYVADYLADEVLAGISAEQQDFLIRTAPLRRLSGPLCDAVLDREGSRALLDEMFRANLFLVPLDADGTWFRYHHLFADLLLRRLGERAGDERREVLARAATWCEQHGDVDSAIDYALQADDTSMAADLVARHGIGALAAGRGFTVLRWIRSLPHNLVEVSPDHCVIAAWALTLMHVHEPMAGLEDLEVQRRGIALAPGSVTDPIGGYAGRALDMLAAGRRAFPHVDDVAQHARVLLATADDEAGPVAALRALEEARDEIPETNLALRAVAEIRIGELCTLTGLYEHGQKAQDRAREIAILAGSDLLRLSAVTGEALILLLQGRLQAAIALVDRELADREFRGESLGTYVGNLYATLSAAHLERDELASAEASLALAWSAWGASGAPSEAWRAILSFGRPRPRASQLTFLGVLWAFYTHIRLLIRRGQTDAALAQLDEVEASSPSALSPTHRVVSGLLRAQAWCADPGRSLVGRRRQREPFLPSGMVHWDRAARLASARMVLFTGDRSVARTECAAFLTDTHESDRDLTFAEALILDGVATFEDGAAGTRHALGRIEEALEVTAPESRVAPWLESGEAVVPLLEKALRENRASAEALGLAAKLLRNLQQGVQRASHPGVSDLSRRELAVLRLLAAGHSNAAIAATLFLAVGTVKTHTHNIFGKLGVANRTQAARIAREAGLLG